jgi:hypothetical protein
MQCVDDCGYLQAWLSIAGCRRQQLLSGLTKIAGFPHGCDNLLRLDGGGCRHRPQCQLLGQP